MKTMFRSLVSVVELPAAEGEDSSRPSPMGSWAAQPEMERRQLEVTRMTTRQSWIFMAGSVGRIFGDAYNGYGQLIWLQLILLGDLDRSRPWMRIRACSATWELSDALFWSSPAWSVRAGMTRAQQEGELQRT